MVMVSLNISEELDRQIESLSDNKSEFIRQAITEKLGTKDKTIEELEKIELDLANQYSIATSNTLKAIEKALIDKENLKLSELKTLEEKKAMLDQKEKELLAKLTPLLEPIPEIQNFDYSNPDWFNVKNLELLVDMLRTKGIRIGVQQLKTYLYSKPNIKKV